MTRKDSEKDSERPHYYSQFWLDIAAGKRTIGGPKPEDGEVAETDAAEPVLQRRSGRTSEPEEFHNSPLPANGYREEVVHPIADDEYSDPEEVLAQDDEELNEGDYPEEPPLEDEDVPDVDLSDEEEESAVEENESIDYEEEDTEWDNRGRKKAKPTRPNKAPVKKPSKTRRSGF